jgi:hypothetical protein
MKQAADVLRLEKETAEKLAAKAFAKSYLADLVPSVFNNLRENGYFYDPVERDLETGFMSWLMSSTLNELDQSMVARLLLDNLIKEVVSQREVEYKDIERLLNEQLNKPVEMANTVEPALEDLNNTLNQENEENKEQEQADQQETSNQDEDKNENNDGNAD